MKTINIESVQFYNGTETDGFKGQIGNKFKKTTEATYCKTFLFRWSYYTRFTYQTVFSMWQAWMQMYKRTRSWSQILSIGKLPWPQAGTSLCSKKLPGFNRAISGQLSKPERYYRRNKQYQPGIITQERRAINNTNGYHYQPFRC
jgi:hypothetical protein